MRRSFAIPAFVLVTACADRAPPPSRTAERPRPPPAPTSAPAEAPPDSKPEGAPYELAADLERRTRAAKEELGGRTVTAIMSDVFVVIGAPGWEGAQFTQSLALFRNAMAGYMNGRFKKKPDQAISVYLFPTKAAYEAFCHEKWDAPCVGYYGTYYPSERYLTLNIGAGFGGLTHEIVHPIVEADFPEAPAWINEGIASLFEQPVIPRIGEIHGAKNWRHPRLKEALWSKARDKARLDALFGMSDKGFRDEDEQLHYAMARYVCQWLDERGKLWPFYQKWRDNVATDPSGETSFEAVVGMTPAEASPAWVKWALAL